MLLIFFVVVVLLVGLILLLLLVGGVITLFMEKPARVKKVKAPAIINKFVNR
jgi:hypothetical protein